MIDFLLVCFRFYIYWNMFIFLYTKWLWIIYSLDFISVYASFFWVRPTSKLFRHSPLSCRPAAGIYMPRSGWRVRAGIYIGRFNAPNIYLRQIERSSERTSESHALHYPSILSNQKGNWQSVLNASLWHATLLSHSCENKTRCLCCDAYSLRNICANLSIIHDWFYRIISSVKRHTT